MPQIEWTPEMSVGHQELDKQHQMLLEIYNRFDAAAAQGKGTRQVRQLLDELVAYTEIHFRSEEKILAEAGFAGLERHKALHAQLIRKLDGFRADLAAGRRVTTEFRQFLGYWWQEHILDHDMDYGRAHFKPADPEE